MALVEKADGAPSGVPRRAERSAGETIEFAAGKVAERVARKSVDAEEDHVGGHDQGAKADAEAAAKDVGANSVVPEKNDKEDR